MNHHWLRCVAVEKKVRSLQNWPDDRGREGPTSPRRPCAVERAPLTRFGPLGLLTGRSGSKDKGFWPKVYSASEKAKRAQKGLTC